MADTVYLIRHGMTEGNRKKQYIGSTEEPLCEEGRILIQKRAAEGAYPSAGLVFSSPMKRAIETARLIYPAQEVTIIDELREMDFGRFERTTFADNKNDPAYIAWVESNGTLDFPDGEPGALFSARIRVGYERLLRQSAGVKTVSVITHGGVIMALLSMLYPKETGGNPFHWQIGNGEYVKCTPNGLEK